MSDNGEIIPTRDLARVKDTAHNHWRHAIPIGLPWTIALHRECWHTVGSKLRAGDKIDVASGDYRIQFTILALAVNVNTDPPFLDFAYLPVWPRDLELSQPAPQLPPRFIVRMAAGASGTFDVVNAASGEIVRPNLYRVNAEQRAADLDKAAREGEAAMAQAAIQHFAPATQEPTVSPAAHRMRKMRARQREGAPA